MKPKIYKQGRRIRIAATIDGKWHDMYLQEWCELPICPLTERQLRRRASEYLYGKSNLTIEEILTKPIIEYKPSEYTAAEDDLIIKHYKDEGPTWLAKSGLLPGRSSDMIRARASRLGLRRGQGPKQRHGFSDPVMHQAVCGRWR